MSETIAQLNTSATFDLNGRRYQVRRMPAVPQFHMMRKLGPLFAKISPSFLKSDVKDLLDINMISLILDGLSSMDEATCNDIIYQCMSYVSRREGPSWIPMYNASAKMMQFEDMDLPTLMQLVMKVLEHNLGNFSLGGEPSTQEQPSPTKDTSPTSNLPTMPIS